MFAYTLHTIDLYQRLVVDLSLEDKIRASTCIVLSDSEKLELLYHKVSKDTVHS